MSEAQIIDKQETANKQQNAVPLGQVERIVRLRPSSGRSDKFSLNLFKFLKKHGPNYWEVCFSPLNSINGKDDVVYSEFTTIAPNLYVGFLDEDGYFMGARLSKIICNGAKTKTWAYSPSNKFVPVPDFWGRYLDLGKCTIDPEHNLYFDRDRYTVSDDGKTRVCNWCGRVERSHIKERIVKDKIWTLA